MILVLVKLVITTNDDELKVDNQLVRCTLPPLSETAVTFI